MKLSLIDYSFYLMSDSTRCLDAAFVVKLNNKISIQDLHTGANLAFQIYPKSNCKISGKRFTPVSHKFEIANLECSESQKNTQIESFISNEIDLSKDRGVRQLYLKTESHNYLVTRMHHALADGVSFFMWLDAQFSVVYKQSDYAPDRSKKHTNNNLNFKVRLRYHDNPQKISKFSHGGASDVFLLKTEEMSNIRNWKTITLQKPSFDYKSIGVTYNDHLILCFFEALNSFQNQKNLQNRKNGIYIPMNIRENPLLGFGNGSSRIKIYDSYDHELSRIEKIKHIRKQVKWCIDNGLWSTPQKLGVLSILPQKLCESILSYVANKPNTDFGTFVFSHLNTKNHFTDLFNQFSDAFFISQLFKSYQISFVGLTLDQETKITASWDKKQINERDVDLFFQYLKDEFEKDILG